MATLAQVTDDTFFDEVERYGEKVLVFYTADWAKPARQTLPIIEAFAEKYPNIKVMTLDIDDNQFTYQKLGFQGVPATVFYKDGSMTVPIVGGIASLGKLEHELRHFLGEDE